MLLSTGKALTNSLLFSGYGFDRPLTNYLVQNVKCASACMSACMCASTCFIHDDICNLNNRCSVIITKVARVGHESCQLALLQIHAIQPSWTLTAIQQSSVSSFPPYCILHSCYSVPFPFSSSPEKYSCTFHTGG